jgi:hypothetical protein
MATSDFSNYKRSEKWGRGGGDRKQQRQGFQGLTRNAKKHRVIGKE